MGRRIDPLTPAAVARVAAIAPTAEEYRAAAILALGLLLKALLVAALVGIAGRGARATWRRLRRRGRR